MTAARRHMRPPVRQAAIFEVIEKRGKATVEELADKYEASAETIRRDLNILAEAGRVRKVHGGAIKFETAREGSFQERLAKNPRAKQEVAEKLAKLVQPGQSLMIDTGSATLVCADRLSRIRDLTIVTNSIRIAERILAAQNGSEVILLGGRYRLDNAQTVGPQTCAEIARYRTDHVILTASAIDPHGMYDFTEDEAHIARAMVAHARNLTVVADRSKLGRSSTVKVCALDKINRLILESDPDPDFQAILRQAGVKII